MNEDAKLSAANVALATRLLNDLGRNMEGWYDNLHPDLVMELPYGDSVGLPARLEGEAARGMFQTAVEVFGCKMYDINVHPMADPAKVFVEYKGMGNAQGRDYPQNYACIQEFRDGKLIGYREYFDTAVVNDVLGDIIAAA